MTPRAYYNEFDPGAAAWLRELIRSGHIADGDVDERSIEDVCPRDLAGYTQCHFFAGIGGWSLALRMAGWPDARPVWTGSCPCQPFSAAGKGKGTADERHLWPAFFHLIEQRRPAVVFGEQVASADGLGWLDLVRADLEAAGYAAGAADLCAAGAGAPHIRQRLYWVAHSSSARLEGRNAGALGHERATAQRGGGAVRMANPDERTGRQGRADVRGRADRGDAQPRAGSGGGGVPDGVADASSQRLDGLGLRLQPWQSRQGDAEAGRDGKVDGLADTEHDGHHRPQADASKQGGDWAGDGLLDRGAGGLRNPRTGPTDGFWRSADWLACRDGKWRPTQPGTFPLVARVSGGVVSGGDPGAQVDVNKTPEGRVMRLRGYGNSIVPQVAAAFIQAATL